MAGTINLALTQQFDMDGEPLGGGLLYFFAAGTTTPQDPFQDSALTILLPNPIVLDASGRVPMFYLASTLAEGNASGQIKIRLTDDSGVTIIAADNLLIIGPAGGGGGGGTVDATTVLAAGDIKARFGTGPLDGFVRCNGNTIGNAVSGAAERANADCQTLFEYLWSTTVLGVFSGTTPSRGASANADWTAGKRLALPDLRGRTIAGMDDMGTTAASRLTSTFFGVSAATLGNAGGSQSQTLTAAQLPLHTHSGSGATGDQNADHTHGFSWSGTTSDQSADHTHTVSASGSNTLGGGAGTSGAPVSTLTTSGVSNGHTHTYSGSGTTAGMSAGHQHSFSFTTNSGNGLAGSAYAIANPSMVVTFYIKL